MVLYELVAVFVTILAVTIAFFKWKFTYWNNYDIPTLEPSVPFGNFGKVFRGKLSFGLRFGVMQSKVGLATLLKNYRISLNEKTKTPLKFDKKSFILLADGGIWLNIEKL